MTNPSDFIRSGTGVDPLLTESAERLFGDSCTFDAVQAAESDRWAPEIWSAVAESGFALIGVPEEVGGSGGTLADACEVLRVAGSFAAPIPLAESGILGGWLLASVGIDVPQGPVTVVPHLSGDTVTALRASDGGVVLSGVAQRVPWAQQAELIVTLINIGGAPTVVAVPGTAVEVEPAENMAGEPRDTVNFDGVVVPAEAAIEAPDGVDHDTFRLRGALSRAMLMAGALEAMSALTVEYTTDRQQFGRPVGRFQAVQQHLVWGAQDAAITTMAAQVASRDATRDLLGARFQIASAKVVADASASTATRWAHQAHGAMGMTQEYALHHLSRRLWAWRHEYSRPGEWTAAVGRSVEAVGADGLYPLIAS